MAQLCRIQYDLRYPDFFGIIVCSVFHRNEMDGSYHPDRRIIIYRWVVVFVTHCIKVSVMKTKECPSCAMEVDASSKVCPICQYEFAETKTSYKWIAILLVISMILLLLNT